MDIQEKKLQLEARKLELEVRELERPILMRSASLSLLVPIIAALATGLIGYFANNELQKLKIEKEQLLAETSTLKKNVEHWQKTTRGLAADQQNLAGSFVNSVQYYVEIASVGMKYKDDPMAMLKDVEPIFKKYNGFLDSQLGVMSSLRGFASKYKDVIGAGETQKIIAQADAASSSIKKLQVFATNAYKQYLSTKSQLQ